MIKMGDLGHPEGVGVVYHPFLHDYLMDRTELFDFIELPLDLYADTARSSLLDPGQARLRQIIATKPCTWRGTALALGSIPCAEEGSFPSYTLKTIRRLLDMASTSRYTEMIGFQVVNRGAPQAMPWTPAAARWIARRQAEAETLLGIPVHLSLSNLIDRTAPARLDASTFLSLLGGAGGIHFIVDTAIVGAGDLVLGGTGTDSVWAARVAALSLSRDDAPALDRLCALAEQLRPRTIILARDRQLFPFDTIDRDLRRLRSLVVKAGHQAEPAAMMPRPSGESDAESLASFRDYQNDLSTFSDAAQVVPDASIEAPSGSTDAWQNWRNQIDDMHKAQQIVGLLSRGPGQFGWPA